MSAGTSAGTGTGTGTGTGGTGTGSTGSHGVAVAAAGHPRFSHGNSSSSGAYSHHGGSFSHYMGDKISKLQAANQQFEEARSTIFRTCSVFVNGYTSPSREELQRLVLLHGGSFDAYMTSNTTHIVQDNFTDAQIKQLMSTKDKRRLLFHVTTDWVVQSIHQSKRLSEGLFTPADLRGRHGANLGGYFQKSTAVNRDADADTRNTAASTAPSSNLSRPIDAASLQVGQSTSNQAELRNGNAARCNGFESEDDSDSEAPQSTAPVGNHLYGNHYAASGAFSKRLPITTTSDPRYRLTTEGNPDFLNHYLNRSRLSFIGRWRNRVPRLAAEFMQQRHRDALAALRTSTISHIGHGKGRVVVHIDMDCFFVSCLIRSDPDEARREGRVPIAVAWSALGGTAEISSCNYAARKYSVCGGMHMQRAKELCPGLVVLPYDFPLYEELSRKVYEILYRSEALLVEPVSVDEAYLEFAPDCDGNAMAADLRKQILDETLCPASAGIGPNKLLARLATKRGKPNGQFSLLPPVNALEHMSDLDIRELPGVGHRLDDKLKAMDLCKCHQLWQLDLASIKEHFGESLGQYLFEASRGIDNTSLGPPVPQQSIGVDVNWGVRFTSLDNAKVFVKEICAEVSKRLIDAGRKGSTIVVKILKRKASAPLESEKFLGCGRCEGYSKSLTVANRVFTSRDIADHSLGLFAQLMREGRVTVTDLRGITVQVSKLEDMTASDQSATSTSTTTASRMSLMTSYLTTARQPFDSDVLSPSPKKRKQPETQQPSYDEQRPKRPLPSDVISISSQDSDDAAMPAIDGITDNSTYAANSNHDTIGDNDIDYCDDYFPNYPLAGDDCEEDYSEVDAQLHAAPAQTPTRVRASSDDEILCIFEKHGKSEYSEYTLSQQELLSSLTDHDILEDAKRNIDQSRENHRSDTQLTGIALGEGARQNLFQSSNSNSSSSSGHISSSKPPAGQGSKLNAESLVRMKDVNKAILPSTGFKPSACTRDQQSQRPIPNTSTSSQDDIYTELETIWTSRNGSLVVTQAFTVWMHLNLSRSFAQENGLLDSPSSEENCCPLKAPQKERTEHLAKSLIQLLRKLEMDKVQLCLRILHAELDLFVSIWPEESRYHEKFLENLAAWRNYLSKLKVFLQEQALKLFGKAMDRLFCELTSSKNVDGKVYQIPMAVAMLSEFLQTLAFDEEGAIPVDVDEDILDLVVLFLQHHYGEPMGVVPKPIPWPQTLMDVVPSWYCWFQFTLLKDPFTFLRCLRAAEYFIIPPLIDLCHARLARLLLGETSAEWKLVADELGIDHPPMTELVGAITLGIAAIAESEETINALAALYNKA